MLGGLSVAALLAHITNDAIFLLIVFNLAFVLPWEAIEARGFIAAFTNNIDLTSYLGFLNKVPRYEEPEVAPKIDEKKQ